MYMFIRTMGCKLRYINCVACGWKVSLESDKIDIVRVANNPALGNGDCVCYDWWLINVFRQFVILCYLVRLEQIWNGLLGIWICAIKLGYLFGRKMFSESHNSISKALYFLKHETLMSPYLSWPYSRYILNL